MAPIYLRVKELREAKGWSQAELAERASIARATVNRIEQGSVTGVDFATLERLADALGVNAAVLVAHDKAPEAPPKRRGRG